MRLPQLTPSQFRWGKPDLFEIKNNIIDDFNKFVKTVCHWVEVKVLPLAGGYTYTGGSGEDGFSKGKVVLSDLAINAIHQWGEVFSGLGAYSVQEVVFQAGLCLCE